MQYKLFAFHELWLPEIPPSEIQKLSEISKRSLSDNSSMQRINDELKLESDNINSFEEQLAPRASIMPEPYSRVGGRDAFISSLGLESTAATIKETSTNKAVLETITKLKDVEVVIQELECRSLLFCEAREETFEHDAQHQKEGNK